MGSIIAHSLFNLCTLKIGIVSGVICANHPLKFVMLKKRPPRYFSTKPAHMKKRYDCCEIHILEVFRRTKIIKKHEKQTDGENDMSKTTSSFKQGIIIPLTLIIKKIGSHAKHVLQMGVAN